MLYSKFRAFIGRIINVKKLADTTPDPYYGPADFYDESGDTMPDDFYVVYGVCTSCGAPQVEAPDLIDHSEQQYGHCYFKKQPQTNDEIQRAINAISVSCISGLRYGGTNEKILKRLYEIGEGEQCDRQPVGNYKAVIWNKVTFGYEGSIEELSAFLTDRQAYEHKQIINFQLKNDHYFEFIYRWTDGKTGNILKCYAVADKEFRIEITPEEDAYEISIRWNAMMFNAILRLKVSDICWFDQDNKVYSETELR